VNPELEAIKILEARSDVQTPGWSYKLQGGMYGLDYAIMPEVLDIDEKAMSVWIPYASGINRDGVGDLLEIGGIELDRHRKNPIFLFDHGKNVQLPIGLSCVRSGDGRYDLAQYTGVLDLERKEARDNVFFYQGKRDWMDLNGQIPESLISKNQEYQHSLYAEQLYHMVAVRLLGAGSIGYQTIKAYPLRPDPEQGIPQGMHLLRVRRLEGSLVVLPANGDTVRKALAMPTICGKPMCEYLIKSLTPWSDPKPAQVTGGYEIKSADADKFLAVLQQAVNKAAAQEDEDTNGGIGVFYQKNPPHNVFIDVRDWGDSDLGRMIGASVHNYLSVQYGNEQNPPKEWGECMKIKPTEGVKHQPSDDITPEKARQMLRDGTAQGHPLTDKQRRMLGAAAGKDKKALRMKYRAKGKLPYTHGEFQRRYRAVGHMSEGQMNEFRDTAHRAGDEDAHEYARGVEANHVHTADELHRHIGEHWQRERKRRGVKSSDPAEFMHGFDSVDRSSGGHNFVHVGKLRNHLGWERSRFDNAYSHHRRSGTLTVAGPEGREGLSEEDRAAMIRDKNDGDVMYLSRRTKGLELRQKYRKGSMKRLRHGSPGSAVVRVSEKDLDMVKKAVAEHKLKMEHMGVVGGLARVKLIGADDGIDAVAKAFGVSGKSLEQGSKAMGVATKSEIDQDAADMNEEPEGTGMEEGGGGGEPHGAQVIRRIHSDFSEHMEEYDSWLPHTENQRVEKFVHKLLEQFEAGLSEAEQIFSSEEKYKDLPELEGGMKPEEEGIDNEGEEAAGEEVPEEGAGGEEEGGEEAGGKNDSDTSQEEAAPATSETREEPPPEESVQGMEKSKLDKALEPYKPHPMSQAAHDASQRAHSQTQNSQNRNAEAEKHSEAALDQSHVAKAGYHASHETAARHHVQAGHAHSHAAEHRQASAHYEAGARHYEAHNELVHGIKPKEKALMKVPPAEKAEHNALARANKLGKKSGMCQCPNNGRANCTCKACMGTKSACPHCGKEPCECGRHPGSESTEQAKPGHPGRTNASGEDLGHESAQQTPGSTPEKDPAAGEDLGEEAYAQEGKPAFHGATEFQDHEKKSLGEASGFLGMLGQAGSPFDNSHRMDAWHYHKTLTGMLQLEQAHEDLAQTPTQDHVPPAEWEPGVGAKDHGSVVAQQVAQRRRQPLNDIHTPEDKKKSVQTGPERHENNREVVPATAENNNRGVNIYDPNKKSQIPGDLDYWQEEGRESGHRGQNGPVAHAAKWFKALSMTPDFGDPHRAKCMMVKKSLDDILTEKEELHEGAGPDTLVGDGAESTPDQPGPGEVETKMQEWLEQEEDHNSQIEELYTTLQKLQKITTPR
jgi:hypothetical protein